MTTEEKLMDPDFVHGASDLEPVARGLRVHRLPRSVRDRDADPQLALAQAQPSGVRVAVVTTAREVTLEVHTSRVGYRGITRPRGAVDVVVDGTNWHSAALELGDLIEVDLQTGANTFEPGEAERITVDDLPAGEKRVEFWLPHNEQVDLVALHADAPVRPAPRTGPVWLHHGSSISHGSNAATPTGIWPVVAARRAGMHLHNLGFGGSALVDPFLARVLRDTPADVISIKLGINVVNLDVMRLRSFVPAVHGFLDTVRDGHPDTPLVLVSPIFCGIHEQTPGPGAFDPAALAGGTVRFVATGDPADTASGRLTLRVVRDALEEIVGRRSDDPHLSYLDGLTLYGEADAEQHPLPDALHPDSDTHVLIGERFADAVFGTNGVAQRVR